MNLFDTILSLETEIEAQRVEGPADLELFRIKYLGSKNVIKDLFGVMKTAPGDQRKEIGERINKLKQLAEEKFAVAQEALKGLQVNKNGAEKIDLTLPGAPVEVGSLHPVTIVSRQVISIFGSIGFGVAEGPEIEDEWHNFTALNTPPDHPARDMTDTFYIQQNPDVVLRSQTSTVQVRAMEEGKLPIRIIAPGRVYRNETISYKHHVYFHQVEGLYIDRDVSFADLKQTLYFFIQQFFGDEFEIRFRPSFFPFTEPSGELDIRKKGTEKWLEILGCGLVHPNVLKNCGIDPDMYKGFAFGMGIERLVMLKYGFSDIRQMYENDVRILRQFSAAR